MLMLASVACQPPPPPPAPSPSFARAQVFAGFGVWWDVWDWSPSFISSRNPSAKPALGLADVDWLGAVGVQTLYIQTATFRHPDIMLDRALLRRIIDRAHARGIRVVGWYLPEFLDVDADLARLEAIADFGFDGLGIDIESTANPDVEQRSANLIAETAHLRRTRPGLAMAAIPVTSVIWESLNRSWWPDFPYRELSKHYDAWMPMAYFTLRDGEWRDPYRYTVESVTRLREMTGRPDLHVHPVGGEAAGTTVEDLFYMNLAVSETNSIGASIYDAKSTPPNLWDALRGFRREIVK